MKSEFKSIEKEKSSPVTPITKELEERETKEVPTRIDKCKGTSLLPSFLVSFSLFFLNLFNNI